MAEIKPSNVQIKSQYIYVEPEEGVSPDKKARLEDDASRVIRPPIHENLCRVLVDVPPEAPMPVCSAKRCRYVHDVGRYLQNKPPDIAAECYIYKAKGHCPRGITCRFGSHHITPAGRNLTDVLVQKKYEESSPKTLNFYSREMEAELRKRTYDFRRSEEILKTLPKPAAPAWVVQGCSDIDFTEDVDVTVDEKNEDRLGPCPEEESYKEHLAGKKKLDWNDKLYLPSLTNFGHLPFRRICKEFGADVTCSEPLIAGNLLDGSSFEWLLGRRHQSEDLFGVQLYGNTPFILTRAAQLIDEKTNADFIDLRYGNPGDNLKYQSKGSLCPSVLRCVSRVTALPITVCSKVSDFAELLPHYKACGVSLITLSGRKESREIDWPSITEAANQVSPIPVMAYSDVVSYSEYAAVRKSNPQLAGLLLGQGALVKPWLFAEIRQQRDWDISSSERFDIAQRFVHYGLDHWGSDAKGVEMTRRFLLDWLSFQCRYIPIGILEKPPQKLNDRCVRFVGRDDMETLLGSHEVKDWIKISEMLLGPTPEGLTFIPKIRPGHWPCDP